MNVSNYEKALELLSTGAPGITHVVRVNGTPVGMSADRAATARANGLEVLSLDAAAQARSHFSAVTR